MTVLTLVWYAGIIFAIYKLSGYVFLYLNQKIGVEKTRDYGFAMMIVICICMHIRMATEADYSILTWILTGLIIFDLTMRLLVWALRKKACNLYISIQRDINTYKAELKEKGIETDSKLDSYYRELNRLYDIMPPKVRETVKERIAKGEADPK